MSLFRQSFPRLSLFVPLLRRFCRMLSADADNLLRPAIDIQSTRRSAEKEKNYQKNRSSLQPFIKKPTDRNRHYHSDHQFRGHLEPRTQTVSALRTMIPRLWWRSVGARLIEPCSKMLQ
mgnify:CR=1 FL=1